MDEPSFDYSTLFEPEQSWQEDHHENKYCDLQCSHTCNYKAVSPSYLDNLVWRESEVNHYYEPKLIIDLSNWKEQQSKEKGKAKSKCEKNGLVKAQIAMQGAEKTQSPVEKDREQEKHLTEKPQGQQSQGFDFDSFIASTIKLSLQPEPCQEVVLLHEVGFLNELNSSVSQLEAARSCSLSMSKSISQEKEEKCLVNLAQLGGGGLGCSVGDGAWPACPWESFGSGERVGENGCLIDEACWDIRKEDQLQKESTYTSYLDHLFSRKEEGAADTVAGAETEPSEVRELDESFLGRTSEIVLNVQLDSLALPVFDSTDDLPLKSIQASFTPCAVKCSPQVAHKTWASSSIFKHLN